MGGIRFSRSSRSRTDRQLELAVECGQVVCPGRGIVDVELCFTCRSYRGMHDGSSERLVCSPATEGLLARIPFGSVPR
jgi:hypothetical protein